MSVPCGFPVSDSKTCPIGHIPSAPSGVVSRVRPMTLVNETACLSTLTLCQYDFGIDIRPESNKEQKYRLLNSLQKEQGEQGCQFYGHPYLWKGEIKFTIHTVLFYFLKLHFPIIPFTILSPRKCILKVPLRKMPESKSS